MIIGLSTELINNLKNDKKHEHHSLRGRENTLPSSSHIQNFKHYEQRNGMKDFMSVIKHDSVLENCPLYKGSGNAIVNSWPYCINFTVKIVMEANSHKSVRLLSKTNDYLGPGSFHNTSFNKEQSITMILRSW